MRASLGLEIRAASIALELMRLGEALPAALITARQSLPKESWSAVQDMAYRAVRSLGLTMSLAELLNNKTPSPEVLAMQLVTLAQLLEARRPAAVVLDQVVEVCKASPSLRFSAGFMNAVMRRFLREQAALVAQASRSDQARYKLPSWWIELLRRDHPQQWQQIIENSGEKASMSLRVNQRKIGFDAYLDLLSAQGLAFEVMADEPTGAQALRSVPALRLKQAVDVNLLPGWAQGFVSVQDLGAQLAAPLLQLAPGMRVLDACAAPGGKSAHILELVDCSLTSLEIDAARAARIDENFARLGLNSLKDCKAVIKIGDASQPRLWWDGQGFDRILVDAPCSASGIVGRHPDIPWLRRRSDITTLSAQQGRILHALWPLLKPGGKLLFCTCSVFRDEGEYLLTNVSRELHGVSIEPLQWQFGSATAVKFGHLLPTRLPHREHDGFFFARLTKTGPKAT